MYRQAGTPGGDASAGGAAGAGSAPDGNAGGGARTGDDVIDAEVVDEDRKG